MYSAPTHQVAHWHVTLTLSGAAWSSPDVSDALHRLVTERPLLQSCRYCTDTAELRYWEQAADVHDAAAMALRLWGEHKRSAGLPDWQIVGLEVVDRETFHRRVDGPAVRSAAAELAEVRLL